MDSYTALQFAHDYSSPVGVWPGPFTRMNIVVSPRMYSHMRVIEALYYEVDDIVFNLLSEKRSSMTTTEILMAARDRIMDPENWASRGGAIIPYVKDCAVTAIEFFGCNDPTKRARTILSDASWALYKCAPVTVNDGIGHSAVMEMYDYAIRLAKEAADSDNPN